MEKNEIFTVENAKVANIEYQIYTHMNQGYIKEGDGLVYVVVVRTLIDLKEQKVTTILRDVNNKEYVRYGSFDIYNSPDDFEGNNPVRRSKYQTFDLVRKASYNTLVDCLWVESDPATDGNPQYGYIAVWVFENGEPKQIPVVVDSVHYDESGWHLAKGSLPDKYWESKKDAFSCNEYKVIDSDGDEFIEQGVQMRLSLTKEQWAIVNEMKALYKKAIDSGIKFVWDRDNCDSLKAINMQNVAEYGYDIEAHEGGQLVPFNDVMFAETEICFYDYCGCDHSDSFALKPTEREKKIWLKKNEQ